MFLRLNHFTTVVDNILFLIWFFIVFCLKYFGIFFNIHLNFFSLFVVLANKNLLINLVLHCIFFSLEIDEKLKPEDWWFAICISCFGPLPDCIVLYKLIAMDALACLKLPVFIPLSFSLLPRMSIKFLRLLLSLRFHYSLARGGPLLFVYLASASSTLRAP